jgi:hypothetical protein
MESAVRRGLVIMLLGASLLTTLLVSRFVILMHPPPLSDARMHYGLFALEFELASRKGQTIYDVEAAEVKKKLARARATGTRAEDLEDSSVDYPPLAQFVMRIPLLYPGTELSQLEDNEFINRYWIRYRISMAGAEVILVAALIALIRRLYPQESPAQQMERLLMYLVITVALWPFLYDRLDLIQATMVQLALVTLLGRTHYAWSLAMLALAINFKLMPAVLAPVFLIGTMPAVTRLILSSRTARSLAVRALVLISIVIVLFLPYFFYYGADCFGFVAFHHKRGLEIGSMYSSVLLGLTELGYAAEVYYSHYCINIRSSISKPLSTAVPYTMAILLLAGALLCWNHFRSMARRYGGSVSTSATMAQLHPREMVSYSLLMLLLCQVSNKVFSPQYMLWTAPLVPLVFSHPSVRRIFTWTFVLGCVLTTILFPYLYFTDLAPHVIFPDLASQLGNQRFGSPTHRFIILLGIRNLLVLGLTIGLAFQLWVSCFPHYVTAICLRTDEAPAGSER